MSKVVKSDNPDFKAGDYVTGITGWEEYSMIPPTRKLRKIHPDDDIPLSYHLGLLGIHLYCFEEISFLHLFFTCIWYLYVEVPRIISLVVRPTSCIFLSRNPDFKSYFLIFILVHLSCK